MPIRSGCLRGRRMMRKIGLAWHDALLVFGFLVALIGFILLELMGALDPFLIVSACSGAALSLFGWLTEVWQQWNYWRRTVDRVQPRRMQRQILPIFRLSIATFVAALSNALAIWTVLTVSPSNVATDFLGYAFIGLVLVLLIVIPADWIRYALYHWRSR
jgi:hypothetical protein